jgi:hypothetical protein
MGSTYGHLGLPRSSGLTIGQRRVGGFESYSPDQVVGRACALPILNYKRVVVVPTGRIIRLDT